MLIEISKEIIESAQRNDEFALRCLNYLGMAFRNRKHIVYAEQPQLNRLIAIKELPVETRNVFLYIQGKLTTVVLPLKNILKFRAKLMLTGRSERQPELLLMNINDFKEFELYEECHLLAENIFDCKIYKQIGLHYISDNGIKEVSLNMLPLQGGGAATCRVYREEAEGRQHYCLALLDSDKGFPKCKKVEDTTYGKVKKEDESLHPVNCMCEKLQNTREVENLIPSRYLRNRYKDKDLIKANIDMAYIDLKSGLLPKLLWFSEALDYYKKLFSADATVLSTISGYEAKKVGKKKDDYCKDVKEDPAIIKGLGDKITEFFLDDNPENAISKMTPDTNGQRKDWVYMGRLVAQWCCAPIIVSTI